MHKVQFLILEVNSKRPKQYNDIINAIITKQNLHIVNRFISLMYSIHYTTLYIQQNRTICVSINAQPLFTIITFRYLTHSVLYPTKRVKQTIVTTTCICFYIKTFFLFLELWVYGGTVLSLWKMKLRIDCKQITCTFHIFLCKIHSAIWFCMAILRMNGLCRNVSYV